MSLGFNKMSSGYLMKNVFTETVSNSAILDIIDTCLSLMIIDKKTLRDIGLVRSELLDPTQRCDEKKLIDLWNWINNNHKEKPIPALISENINPETKGVLASWVSQCESILQALDVFINNISVMSPSERWTLEYKEDQCILYFYLDKTKGYPDIAIERSILSMISWAKMLSNQPLSANKVNFSFKKPKYHLKLTELTGCHINYCCSENSIFFNKKYLDLPIIGGNRYLYSIAKNNTELIKREMNRENPVSNKIKDILEKKIGTSDFTIDKVSSEMSMSRQTLYRKLKNEGTSYQEILDFTRKNMALNLLLDSNGNITYVSFSLGFKDVSSFYKAFSRWFGTSPKNYQEINQ